MDDNRSDHDQRSATWYAGSTIDATAVGTITGQGVLDALTAQIAVLDRNGAIVMANQAWRRFVATQSGERATLEVGASYRDVWRDGRGISGPGAHDAQQGIEAVLRGDMEYFATEYQRRSGADGRWFRLEATSLQAGGAVLTHTDITAQHVAEYTARLYEQRQRLRGRLRRRRRIAQGRRQSMRLLVEQSAQLARANAELKQFASVVSHELHEPLRMVARFLELLRRRYGGRLDAQADEYIGYAYDGAVRMQALIDKLLAYTRLDRPGRPPRPVDCDDVLARAIGVLQVALTESQAEVTFDPMPTVLGDDVEIGLVFRNLISNAIKFCGPGHPRIHIGARREGDRWLFSVRDYGIGIAPGDAERIFDMFVRAQNRDAYPGNGIGLAICRKVVMRYGGRIWVESPADGGALFCFTLPAAP